MSLWSDMQDENGGLTPSQGDKQKKIVATKQIKFFVEINEHTLEREVNKYLEELSRDNKKVVDIRNNNFLGKYGDKLTVMVIYEV